jgi:hypothetical protein
LFLEKLAVKEGLGNPAACKLIIPVTRANKNANRFSIVLQKSVIFPKVCAAKAPKLLESVVHRKLFDR